MDAKPKIVIVLTHGLDNERSSVAWSVASASIASDFEVTVFLTSSGVDWARKGAADAAHPNPFDPPIKDMIADVLDNGGTVLVCPPCLQVRGYTAEDLAEGMTIAGSLMMLEKIKQGATTISF